jgi:plastocyanin
MEREMRLVVLVIASAAVTALLLAGCGSGDDESSGGDAGGGGQTIEIVETEFKLDPSTVTVDAPGTYTLHVANEGGAVHALEIEGQGLEEETEDIDPGGSADLTVEITEPGGYELYCPIDGHREQGMEGTLRLGGGTGGTTTDEDEDETTTEEDETTTEEDGGGGGGYGYR